MARKNNEITIHRCIFAEQARKVKEAIVEISKKESLCASDTQAIRKLTEVYDVLSNPVQENDGLHLATDNNGHYEVSR